MTSQPRVVSHHDEVRAMLSDPDLTVVPAPRPPFALTVAWLRGAVSRFADGPVHAARRAAAVEVLAGLDTRVLRAEAFRLASSHPREAELVPVQVLALAFGVRAEDVRRAARAVAAIAPVYLPSPASPLPSEQDIVAADESLVRLSRLLGDPEPERLAVLAGLLAQACDSTAGLIRNALAADAAPCPVEDLLAETLRHDPPVRVLRRTAARPEAAGGGAVPGAEPGVVVLDVAAANRDPEVFDDPDRFRPGRAQEHLTFGAGLRPCPGQTVALALAAGVVEAVRG
ncbi:cytochrome P450 [Streptosporangium sp. NPDC000396]|uniref:cytochrome P450 n=1 Tax=Streptosporangium sp. NPDC000396 TaxID=3366185 RepID=UPI003673AFB4